MTLLVDPPELAQYAKRGDPHIDHGQGSPSIGSLSSLPFSASPPGASGISGSALIIVDSF